MLEAIKNSDLDFVIHHKDKMFKTMLKFDNEYSKNTSKCFDPYLRGPMRVRKRMNKLS